MYTQFNTNTQSGLFGGGGGEPFSDLIPDGARICEVCLRHGEYIDGIRISWTMPDGTRVDGPYHGGQGGSETICTIPAGDMLWPFQVSSGDLVDSITFKTGNGTWFGPYGGGGGYRHEDVDLISPPIDMMLRPPDGVSVKLLGIYGRSGDVLDAIGFWFRYDL